VCRWTTLGWPRKIQDQSENCTKQLEQDEERFQKNLSNDQATFEDRLDSLEVCTCTVHIVANMHIHTCIHTYVRTHCITVIHINYAIHSSKQ